ncbi:hypothetical protein VdG1_06671 [Verticillium dahliae VDG1]|nr:hypothetical protein VdG1_06671 [Verticillium dahliae VDG1]
MSTDTAAAAVASQAPTAPASEDTAATYESTHVHAVYEAIAPHFSATRHKPWPRVASFLDSLPAGAVGLDIGCGNGKYLAVSPHLHLLGSDRSANLVALARDNTGGSGAPPKKAKGDGPPVEVTTTGPSARRNQEGELDADIQAVGGVVLESGYERDNWWAICSRGPEER